jgi:hypothetical protein
MATGSDVMAFYYPNGGYYIQGDDFSTVFYDEGVKPLTKAQFDAGFAKADAWKAQKDADAITAKESAQAKLAALGLTTDDLKALGL